MRLAENTEWIASKMDNGLRKRQPRSISIPGAMKKKCLRMVKRAEEKWRAQKNKSNKQGAKYRPSDGGIPDVQGINIRLLHL